MSKYRAGFYSIVIMNVLAWLIVLKGYPNKLVAFVGLGIYIVCAVLINKAINKGAKSEAKSGVWVAYASALMYAITLYFYISSMSKGGYAIVCTTFVGLGMVMLFSDVKVTCFATAVNMLALFIAHRTNLDTVFLGVDPYYMPVVAGNIFLMTIFMVLANILGLKAQKSVMTYGKDLQTKNSQLSRVFDKLRETVLGIKVVDDSIVDGIHVVSKVSTGISEAIEEFSASMEEQTANVQEIGSSIIQIDSSFKDVIDLTETLKAKVGEAKDGLVESNKVSNLMFESLENVVGNVNETKETTLNLSNYIDEVTKIVTVINNIAEQTNLLALNASIESARAGEHGRGFSVVALRVGELAKESKESTRVIKNIMESLKEHITTIVYDVDTIDATLGTCIETKEKFEKSMRTFKTVFDYTTETTEKLDSNIQELGLIASTVSTNTEEMVATISSNNETLFTIQESLSNHKQSISDMEKDINKLSNYNLELNSLCR